MMKLHSSPPCVLVLARKGIFIRFAYDIGTVDDDFAFVVCIIDDRCYDTIEIIKIMIITSSLWLLQ